MWLSGGGGGSAERGRRSLRFAVALVAAAALAVLAAEVFARRGRGRDRRWPSGGAEKRQVAAETGLVEPDGAAEMRLGAGSMMGWVGG